MRVVDYMRAISQYTTTGQRVYVHTKSWNCTLTMEQARQLKTDLEKALKPLVIKAQTEQGE